jgi:hypothetical protein
MKKIYCHLSVLAKMREHTLEKHSRGSSVPSVTENKVHVDSSYGPSKMLAIGSNS